jgi:single-strand DNA-binding protein
MWSKTVIVGRLTADPELKQTPNGVTVTSFSVAVNRSYAPKGGDRQVDFYDVVAWRQTAEFICRYFAKGASILVEGTMESRTYKDKNDQNRRVWELIANNVSFTGGKNESQGSGGSRVEDREPPPARGQSSSSNQSYGGGQSTQTTFNSNVEDFADIDDDGDLPF